MTEVNKSIVKQWPGDISKVTQSTAMQSIDMSGPMFLDDTAFHADDEEKPLLAIQDISDYDQEDK